MTHDTEADRAEFELMRDAFESKGNEDYKAYLVELRSGDSYKQSDIADAFRNWKTAWQAARRAPAAPVQQEPTSKQVVLGAGALLGQPENTADNRHPDWHSAVAKARSVYLAMLAAAPQPPEAAPVQLPDPAAWRDPKNFLPSQGCTYEKSTAKKWAHIYTEPLYTEQQVRELLAAHGIGKDKA